MSSGNLHFNKFLRGSSSTLKFENQCLQSMDLESVLEDRGRRRGATARTGEGGYTNGRGQEVLLGF